MTLPQLAAIALFWSVIIYVAVSAWRRFCSRRPKPEAPRVIVTASLNLTTQQLADVQAGVLLVGMGATRVATVSFDHVTERGCGSICVLVVDGTFYTQAIEPAIQRRLAQGMHAD